MDTAAYGDSIDKMSQKMNLSAAAYQEWDFILQHCGSSIDSLQPSMKTLATAVESGSDAFQRLGMSQEAVADMSNEELFSATIRALQNVESESERTYLAGKLLGRGATELGPLLNTTADDMEAMRKQAHELGGVMSDDAVKGAAAFQDSLQNLKTVFAGTKNAMLADFFPSIVNVMDGLTMIFSGGDGSARIHEGIDEFMSKISSSIPKAVSAGIKIVSNLSKSIFENLILKISEGIETGLPQLLAKAPEMIDKFLKKISKSMPKVLKKGTEIVKSVVKGITKSIPELVKSVPKLIVSVTDFLSDGLPAFFESGIEIAGTLFTGILEALPQLAASIPDILMSIIRGAGKIGISLLECGMTLGRYILDGINKVFPELGAGIEAFIGSIDMEEIKKSFDDISQRAQRIGVELGPYIDTFERMRDAFGQMNREIFHFDLQGLALAQKASNEFLLMLVRSFKQTFDTISLIFGAIGDVLHGDFDSAGEKISEAISGWETMIEGDWDSIKDIFADAKDIGSGIVKSMQTGWSSIWGEFLGMATGDWSGLVGAIFGKMPGGSGGSLPGRAIGMDYVPYDGYVASLHRGEMILNRQESDHYRRGIGNPNSSGITIVQNISAVPQTPAEFAAATQAYFEQARWST